MSKPRWIVVSSGYPSPDHLYRWAYVHARVRRYVRYASVEVLVPSGESDVTNYEHEGVMVHRGCPSRLLELLHRSPPEVLLVHQPGHRVMAFVDRAQRSLSVPKVTWFHGAEAVWYFRVYPIEVRLAYLSKVVVNAVRMTRVRRYLINSEIEGDGIVFVSNWMRQTTENHLRLRLKHAHVIPNPVDSDIFGFKQRMGRIKRIICVRSHENRKYAVDLVIRAFANSPYTIDIYGDGSLFQEHVALAKRLGANVCFMKRFFTQQELAKLYWEYDLGVMLTRADAQGVSMCEMQMTGMPVITSAVGGVTEFKTPGMLFVSNSAVERVRDVLSDIDRSDNLAILSRQSHVVMRGICGADVVIAKEIDLIDRVCQQSRYRMIERLRG